MVTNYNTFNTSIGRISIEPTLEHAGFYFGIKNNSQMYRYYERKLIQYRDLNPKPEYDMALVDNQLQIFYLLTSNNDVYLARATKYKNMLVERVQNGEDPSLNFFLPLVQNEIRYFSRNYQKVIDEFRLDQYDRSLAQHPADRISMATRACIYPLSLYHLERFKEARQAFLTIEQTIDDVKDSFVADEFRMIKNIIFPT